jgi:hypothetical protein
MAGQKTFINNTSRDIAVTIVVRAGDDPSHTAGSQNLTVNANSQQQVSYGNDSNIYLNGLSLTPVSPDGLFGEVSFSVTTRGSPIDNALNTNSVMVLDGSFTQLNAHN